MDLLAKCTSTLSLGSLVLPTAMYCRVPREPSSKLILMLRLSLPLYHFVLQECWKGVGLNGFIHQVFYIVDKVAAFADNPSPTNGQILNPNMLGNMSGIDTIDNKLGCANVLDGVLNLLCQRRKAAIKPTISCLSFCE